MYKPAILGGEPLFISPLSFLKPYLPSYDDMEKDLREILASGILTKGRVLKNYEKDLENYLSVPCAVGVSSCTLGLILLLRCLDLRGEVIVPSFTFPATVHAIMWNNLDVVFADCDPETFNISLSSVKKAITSKTSAILAVHIFGNPADAEELEDIARENNLKLIFDSAAGFGSTIEGRPLGCFGDGEVFSTSPTKLLITGEGGIVTTGNEELAAKLRIAIEYGNPGDYDCLFAGLNARLEEINSLLGIYSLKMLDENVKIRNRLAEIYKIELSSIPGISFQKIKSGCISSYKDFAILIGKDFGLSRDRVWKALKAEGIETRRYFYPPNHRQKALAYMDYDDNLLRNTNKIAGEVLCLPIYSSMTEETIKKVAQALKNLYEYKEDILNKNF